MTPVSIHRADSTDVGELVELMAAFYAESAFPLDRRWAADSFERLLSQPALGSVWLANAGGGAVGHAVLSLRYTMEYGALGGIDDLYVRPEFRRRQVASGLLQALVEDCQRRGGASLHVEVGESNAAALALYRRFGLAPVADGRVFMSGALRLGVEPRV